MELILYISLTISDAKGNNTFDDLITEKNQILDQEAVYLNQLKIN